MTTASIPIEWVGGPMDGGVLQFPVGTTVAVHSDGRTFDVPIRIRPDGQRVLLWSELVEMIGTSKA